jgi:AraC-like DNA-binding protein
MIGKQTYFPKKAPTREVSLISTLGLDRPQGEYRHHPGWSSYHQGKSWGWRQFSRHDTFLLMSGEGFRRDGPTIDYTKWEDHIKISFWLSGEHTTILDGIGQCEHAHPEVFIVAGPPEMVKIDLSRQGTHTSSVALCLKRDFFALHLDLDPQELPEPLRSFAISTSSSPCLQRYPLTSYLAVAARAVIAAPPNIRRDPQYAQAKATELTCLLVNQIKSAEDLRRAPMNGRVCRESRLHEARDIMLQRYREPLTLGQISREVGLNRLALTTGFRSLFGMSVHDYLLKQRMECASQLLRDDAYTIEQVAHHVGYSHACTFSTAFRVYFGHTPKRARG